MFRPRIGFPTTNGLGLIGTNSGGPSGHMATRFGHGKTACKGRAERGQRDRPRRPRDAAHHAPAHGPRRHLPGRALADQEPREGAESAARPALRLEAPGAAAEAGRRTEVTGLDRRPERQGAHVQLPAEPRHRSPHRVHAPLAPELHGRPDRRDGERADRGRRGGAAGGAGGGRERLTDAAAPRRYCRIASLLVVTWSPVVSRRKWSPGAICAREPSRLHAVTWRPGARASSRSVSTTRPETSSSSSRTFPVRFTVYWISIPPRVGFGPAVNVFPVRGGPSTASTFGFTESDAMLECGSV